MDVFVKAKELGELIAVSQEMIDLKKAEVEMENDEKAKQIMNEYKLLQIELVKATKEKKDIELINDIKEKLLLKQEDLNSYDKTKAYLESKLKFDKLMKDINNVIVYSITGEEPCSPSKCSSCSGGCK